jgi:hypothetical protein
MPGALAPERHDNTLDGEGWSPMLSRLLGVFVFYNTRSAQVFGFCNTHNRILPLQQEDHDDDYFYTICCGQLQPSSFGPRSATLSILCLINFFHGHLRRGGYASTTSDREEEKGRTGHLGWTLWHLNGI